MLCNTIDPTRVFNNNKTALQLYLKGDKILALKELRDVAGGSSN